MSKTFRRLIDQIFCLCSNISPTVVFRPLPESEEIADLKIGEIIEPARYNTTDFSIASKHS